MRKRENLGCQYDGNFPHPYINIIGLLYQLKINNFTMKAPFTLKNYSYKKYINET